MLSENISISEADRDDWESAMELAWLTFLKFDAPDYSQEGTENFLKFISDEKLFKMFLAGEYPVYVAKSDGKIIGMAAFRMVSHISLLFVREGFQRCGIGKALLKYAQGRLLERNIVKMTVNASPYGVPFYERLGFVPTDEEKNAEGILYTPMVCLSQIT